jgi:cell division protein FtsB
MQSQQTDAYLVYDDESMSVEEKRAELERYRYDEEVLKQQMNKIDQSIEYRVSQMIGSRVGI